MFSSESTEGESIASENSEERKIRELFCGSPERDRVLAHAEWDRFALADAPERYRADHEVVLAAVQHNGLALDFAAEKCKRDRRIVLAAVDQNGEALEYAAEEFKRDREIVLAAIRASYP
eukprot:4501194-Amphidinium_carterae.1